MIGRRSDVMEITECGVLAFLFTFLAFNIGYYVAMKEFRKGDH